MEQEVVEEHVGGGGGWITGSKAGVAAGFEPKGLEADGKA